MKTITLWQPWATLIAIGAKKYETRNWATNYRGLLAIHAAKRFQEDEKFLCTQYPFRESLVNAGYTKVSELPLGAIVAIVEVVGCWPTGGMQPDNPERAFGNFMPGRYAWELRLIKCLDKPIQARGAQGFWEWDAPANILDSA